MGCANSKDEQGETTTHNRRRSAQYDQAPSGGKDAKSPRATEAFVGSAEEQDQTLNSKSHISSVQDGSMTAGGMTSDDRGSNVSGSTNNRQSSSRLNRFGESHSSHPSESQDPEVTVYMTAQNSPTSMHTLDVLSLSGSHTQSEGGYVRPFDPRGSRMSVGAESGHGSPRGSNQLGNSWNNLSQMSPTGASFASAGGVSFNQGFLSPTTGELNTDTFQSGRNSVSVNLKPFSISQFELDEKVGSPLIPSTTQGATTTPDIPDNNMGDQDQEHIEARVNRQISRKESFAQPAEEPGKIMRSIEEAFRSTKMRAVAAFSHETDHEELARVALKADNPKTISSCQRWVKVVEDPVPRVIKASTLNELRTLTESPTSIHYARSMTSLLIQHHQQQLMYQQQCGVVSLDDGSGQSQRLSGTQQQMQGSTIGLPLSPGRGGSVTSVHPHPSLPRRSSSLAQQSAAARGGEHSAGAQRVGTPDTPSLFGPSPPGPPMVSGLNPPPLPPAPSAPSREDRQTMHTIQDSEASQQEQISSRERGWQ